MREDAPESRLPQAHGKWGRRDGEEFDTIEYAHQAFQIAKASGGSLRDVTKALNKMREGEAEEVPEAPGPTVEGLAQGDVALARPQRVADLLQSQTIQIRATRLVDGAALGRGLGAKDGAPVGARLGSGDGGAVGA